MVEIVHGRNCNLLCKEKGNNKVVVVVVVVTTSSLEVENVIMVENATHQGRKI